MAEKKDKSFEEIFDELLEVMFSDESEKKDEDKKEEEKKAAQEETEEEDEEYTKLYDVYLDEAKEVYESAIKEVGKEFADDLVAMSALEATITYAIEQHLPIRYADVDAYNKYVKRLIPYNQYQERINEQYRELEKLIAEGKQDIGAS